jgi:predicted nicotinamide N-methyase
MSFSTEPDRGLPAIPGGWAEQEVIVGERVFRLVLPATPEAFLNADKAAGGVEDAVRTTYWQYLWPVAAELSRLVMQFDWKPGLEALELGAGVGLVGLAALAVGLNVTFSDCDPVAVQVALRNSHRNGFDLAAGLVLDWRVPSDRKFPVILASDVLYRPQHITPLLRVIDAMLKDDGMCWIGDPGRWSVPDFLSAAAKAGFSIRLRNSDGRDVAFPVAGRFVLIELHRHRTVTSLTTCRQPRAPGANSKNENNPRGDCRAGCRDSD